MPGLLDMLLGYHVKYQSCSNIMELCLLDDYVPDVCYFVIAVYRMYEIKVALYVCYTLFQHEDLELECSVSAIL